MNHEEYMQIAIEQSNKAYINGDVPVGAIVVYKGEIIGKGYNQREQHKKVDAHAEIVAMNEAADYLDSWNLQGCTLYVTLEPCPMCAGAIMQSHVDAVVYGAYEPKSGSYGSVFNINEIEGFNHYPQVVGGILKAENEAMMKKFFGERRQETISIKRVDASTWEKYLNVRKEVFVKEHNVLIVEEIDEYDTLQRKDVIHVVALKKGQAIGAARYIMIDDTLKVGRVAVLPEYRGQHVGLKLMNYIEKQAVNTGYHYLKLGAQLQAIPFYEKSGYEVFGPVFDDAGIDHCMMIKDIKKSN